MGCSGRVFARKGSVGGTAGSHFHTVVFECAGETRALRTYLPIRNSFRRQEVKEGVVGGRNRSPEAGLPRPFRFALGEVLRLLKQIVRKCHLLAPCSLPEHGLLGFASKSNVWNKAP